MYVKYLWRTLVNIVLPGHLKVGSSSEAFGQVPNVHSSSASYLLAPNYWSWAEPWIVFHCWVGLLRIFGRLKWGRRLCLTGDVRLHFWFSVRFLVRSNVKIFGLDIKLVVWY
jgi:hypothetical protein